MKKRFIFDEGYIKRYAKRDKIKWLVIGLSLLVLIIVIIIVILATKNDEPKDPVEPAVPKYEFKEKLTVEAGSVIPEVVDYFKEYENVDLDDIKIEYPEEFEISYDVSACSDDILEEINNGAKIEDYECAKKSLKTPAVYGVSITLLEEEYTVNLEVVDTVAPTIVTKDVEIFKEEVYKVEDFVGSCYDVTSECQISYYEGDEIDYSNLKEAKEHVVKLVARDDYNNVSEPFEAKLTIKEPEAKLYTVTFNSDGGSSIDNIVVEEGKTIKEPTAPTKDGYKFLGWYIGNNVYNFGTEVTNNITLVAKWEKIKEDSGSSGGSTGGDGGSTTVNVTSVSLDYKKINLEVGSSKTVTATVKPNNATNKSVTWKTSNKNIATVSNGKITGVKAGEAVITATAGGKSASVTVVVREKEEEVTCKYGNTSYNNNLYILSVNVTSNNCAVDPNKTYNENVSTRDYQSIVNQLTSMGFSIASDGFDYRLSTVKVKNNAGTGLVGYQFTVTVKVVDPGSRVLMSATYIIKSDGSRQFSTNTIEKNGVKLK